MTERKEFPTLVVASAVCGVGLGAMKFSDMHEAVEWLFGGPVWTHELVHGPTQDAYVSEALEQFPKLPTRAEAEKDWQAARERVLDEYGPILSVAKGTAQRRASPIETLKDIRPDAQIIPVLTKANPHERNKHE